MGLWELFTSSTTTSSALGAWRYLTGHDFYSLFWFFFTSKHECNPMDCNWLGSSVHGILQAWLLEWVAMLSSRGFSWPRDRTWVSCVSHIVGGFFTTEPPGEAHDLLSLQSWFFFPKGMHLNQCHLHKVFSLKVIILHRSLCWLVCS